MRKTIEFLEKHLKFEFEEFCGLKFASLTAIVSIIAHHHLRANQNNFLIVEHNAAVVGNVEVLNRHADIDQHIVRMR